MRICHINQTFLAVMFSVEQGFNQVLTWTVKMPAFEVSRKTHYHFYVIAGQHSNYIYNYSNEENVSIDQYMTKKKKKKSKYHLNNEVSIPNRWRKKTVSSFRNSASSSSVRWVLVKNLFTSLNTHISNREGSFSPKSIWFASYENEWIFFDVPLSNIRKISGLPQQYACRVCRKTWSKSTGLSCQPELP